MLCPNDIVTPVSRYLALTCQAALHRQLRRQNVTETVAIVISGDISSKLEQYLLICVFTIHCSKLVQHDHVKLTINYQVLLMSITVFTDSCCQSTLYIVWVWCHVMVYQPAYRPIIIGYLQTGSKHRYKLFLTSLFEALEKHGKESSTRVCQEFESNMSKVGKAGSGAWHPSCLTTSWPLLTTTWHDWPLP